ncbi:hypothetical protein A3L11_04645 [Thermococcus siculi]|uniref:Uncharacterized protein n=1 Tax=Thermococcus siculi TaxID=72803 RepID=A0A2Z2ML80_9EURY|nr:hypothetical protein [Thermococcus siculi]ASJ08558.1 hypothetical protein A3L11_04645 [Thermococcus siculi]
MEGIEYIYDKHGRIKGVIVPPELWEKVREKIFEPSKYRGIYKGRKDLKKSLRELRDEWERDF